MPHIYFIQPALNSQSYSYALRPSHNSLCRSPAFQRRSLKHRTSLAEISSSRSSTSWQCRAEPDDKEPLPWERNENLKALAKESGDLPFGIYLLGASIIAIAAVGSIFEIINKNAIFGVVPPSSPLWLPILGTFSVTGIPSAGFLFVKAIKSANEESDRQNKADGY